MKKILTAALICSAATAHAASIWSDNFESYDTSALYLETQNPNWLTGPAGTESIAAFDNSAQNPPASFGTKSLAVGGVPPSFGSGDDTSVVYALSPQAASFIPSGPLPVAHFTTDLILSIPTTFTDSFRLSFFDGNSETLSSLLFTKSLTSGFSISRNNGTSTFDTGAALSLNAAYTLDLTMNLDYMKWSATITPVGSTSTPVALFANVDLTSNTAAQKDIGGFAIDWISSDGTNWGDNFMMLDNMVLESAVPEPSSSLLIALGGFACLARRRR
ncbi:MAG: PEP-CTERM sorting domain-containing protein [Akkermansiaceae bacterium]|nr:PEP-CTERM sorting domain-containing protein [Akkermansiaceae bacterium]